MMRSGCFMILLSLLTAGQAMALDCGGKGKPCKTASGEYNIVLPQGWQQGGPAVMHLHGYSGSGAKVVRNKRFAGRFTERGYAVIAPTALPWFKGKPNDWSVRDGFNTYPRNDVMCLKEVLADAMSRARVDPDRVLVTGFSRGGSMVWDLACLAPGFGRAHLLHTHGFADPMVPLEGWAWHNSVFDITVT